ncbi:MAG: chemotaxis response regulator protein-glutamate methylesterase [Pseudomonadota bacterium]
MIKVLVVDDSALVRQLLTELLSSDRDIEVVGTAQDPYVARDKIKQLNPDVITLDVEMPKMDGITFLSNLMRLRPTPVVMISSLTQKGADVTLNALELGAIDFVGKPTIDLAAGLQSYGEEICEKVKIAARADVKRLSQAKQADVPKKVAFTSQFETTDKIIAIGASTGGTEAVREVLDMLPANSPAVLITQHIPESFSDRFAQRLNKTSELKVVEAKDGDNVLPGHAYVAPGSHHLKLVKSGARFMCKLSDAAPVNRHRPSVDVLFDSVADICGQNAVGLILTGMGNDGAAGLKKMKTAGAYTIAQDQASSVVWGMPGEAVKLEAVNSVVPLDNVAGELLKRF